MLFLLDPTALLFIAFAAMTVIQWMIGLVFFGGHALIGVGYFLAAGLAVILGRSWESADAGSPGDFLFSALLIAALMTSGIVLAQWLQIHTNEVWINPLFGRRPFGNLIQSNNAATLLLLGMVAITWFYFRDKLSLWAASAGVVLLVFAFVLTGSRIGFLSFLVLVVLGLLVGLFREQYRAWRGMLVTAVVAFFSIHLLLSLGLGAVVPPADQLGAALDKSSTSVRLLVYRAYLEAAVSQPLMGFGFEQGAKTQLAAYALGHELPGLFTWAHNAILDIATWFGVLMAVVTVSVITALLFILFLTEFEVKRSVYFASVFVLLMHGMVELPLAYAYFLLPFGLLVGAMSAGLRWPTIVIPAAVPGSIALSLGVLLAAIVYDYLRIESAFYTWRFMNANVGNHHPMDIPETLVLEHQEVLLKGLRADAKSISDLDLKRFEQAIFLQPSAAGIQHLATLQLKRGDVSAAQRTADMGYLLSQGEYRQKLAARWKYLGTIDPAYRSVVWRGE